VSDLRQRLQRLRPASRKPSTPPTGPERLAPRPGSGVVRGYDPDEDLGVLPGAEARNAQGAYQLIEVRYPLHQAHGHLSFGDLLGRSAVTAARIARQPALAECALRDLAFIDTETTGLAGGAGTLAFLTGVGSFEENAFVLRQYFLREPSEEPAVIAELAASLAQRAGWVTFNGRAFDVPLLETRFTLNRRRAPFAARPHLDLLQPARWLYRGRLASCSLSSLESHVLGVPRTDDDVPGELIPWMYVHYLRTRDPREMRRVIYHNAIDILSMVTLAAHLIEAFETEPGHSTSPLGPSDWLRLARWHDHDGRAAEAEAAYRRALAGKLSLPERAEALEHLGVLLKRLNRRAEAVPAWEQWASFSIDDAIPHIELSKYYEWKTDDLTTALAWAERAQAVILSQPTNWKQREHLKAITRRLERLRLKTATAEG
jgi:hypothetical protein